MEYQYDTKSQTMREIYRKIEKYARTKARVLFYGPAGVGKEALAAYYRDRFQEAYDPNAPYVAVNCAGIYDSGAEGELFGVEPDSFTGVGEQWGHFHKAHNGILFLDEIGDLAVETQPKLLRAIDPGEACRVGGGKPYDTSSVTVIAATERSLKFIRQALIDRFEAIIRVPCLDERPEDMAQFIHFFFRKALVRRSLDLKNILQLLGVSGDIERLSQGPYEVLGHRDIVSFAHEACTLLVPIARQCTWPANIRGLQRAVNCAVIEAEDMSSPKCLLGNIADMFRLLSQADLVAGEGRLESETHAKVDEVLLERIQTLLPSFNNKIAGLLATFLSEKESRRFKLTDLQNMLQTHGVFRERRALNNWLTQLCDVHILVGEGGGRNSRYRLYEEGTADLAAGAHEAALLALPPDVVWPDGCRDDMDAMRKHLQQARVLYVSGEEGLETKSHCIKALGKELESERRVCYYEFGDMGLSYLLRVMDQAMQNCDTSGESCSARAHTDLTSWIRRLGANIETLFPKESRPLLILNNVHLLKDSLQIKSLYQLIRDWTALSFLLVGDKPVSDLNEFLEYPMSVHKYRPRPLDTSYVRLSDSLLELTEQLAENAHERWAMRRMQEGWTYGPTRNESTKKHPDLLPYDDLLESEKEYDRDLAMETLKSILMMGYRIEEIPPRDED